MKYFRLLTPPKKEKDERLWNAVVKLFHNNPKATNDNSVGFTNAIRRAHTDYVNSKSGGSVGYDQN